MLPLIPNIGPFGLGQKDLGEGTMNISHQSFLQLRQVAIYFIDEGAFKQGQAWENKAKDCIGVVIELIFGLGEVHATGQNTSGLDVNL